MPRFYFHLSNSDECFRDDIAAISQILLLRIRGPDGLRVV